MGDRKALEKAERLDLRKPWNVVGSHAAGTRQTALGFKTRAEHPNKFKLWQLANLNHSMVQEKSRRESAHGRTEQQR